MTPRSAALRDHARLGLEPSPKRIYNRLPYKFEAGTPNIAEGIALGVKVDLVWDPPWNPGMMSEAAKLKIGFF